MLGLCINLDVVLAFKILDQNFEQKFIRVFFLGLIPSRQRGVGKIKL